MKPIQALLAAVILLVSSAAAFAADADTRVYELRTYTSPPGKLDALHARFREHTTKLFEKHGMTNIGYWTPAPNPENKLIYLLAYPSREARVASWKAFIADPEWKKAAAESEANGKIVSKIEARFMTATDFSPAFPPASESGVARTFELRLLTATPGNLGALQARFREKGMALFAKQGVANLHFWQLMPDQKEADVTLLSLHAHASGAAAKESYERFRADPEWLAVKAASEEKAGGPLTTADGIKSIFMKATDYSPMK